MMKVYLVEQVVDEEYGSKEIIGCYQHEEDALAYMAQCVADAIAEDGEDADRFFPWYCEDEAGLPRWSVRALDVQ